MYVWQNLPVLASTLDHQKYAGMQNVSLIKQHKEITTAITTTLGLFKAAQPREVALAVATISFRQCLLLLEMTVLRNPVH